MQEDILAWLRREYGCAADDGCYRTIGDWLAWWRGSVNGFHTYFENAAFGRPVQREMYSLRMAKKVCEDWAAILLNDKTWLHLPDGQAERWLKRVLADEDFWRRSNYLVERAFASGTGACLLRVRGLPDTDWRTLILHADEAGGASVTDAAPGIHGTASDGTPVRFWFDFVDASHIVPISTEGGVITEAAFLSEPVIRGRRYLYAEVHLREADGYRIHNRFLSRREDGSLLEERLPGMPPLVLHTGCPYPFFAILTPNIQSTALGDSGLGQSVYADALDCLRGVDLAFNNFCRDLRLGGKKVFINQSLVRRDEDGTLYSPDDVAQQLFMVVGDSDIAENPLIEEHNPSLRTAENREAVQSQLDYLSFRCGLGTRHYLFSGVQGKAQLTATQYMGERQDMRQNAAKHFQNIASYLRAVVRPLLWCASRLLGASFSPADPLLRFDDSYFVDTESERARDLREVEAGLLTAAEFREKWRA